MIKDVNKCPMLASLSGSIAEFFEVISLRATHLIIPNRTPDRQSMPRLYIDVKGCNIPAFAILLNGLQDSDNTPSGFIRKWFAGLNYAPIVLSSGVNIWCHSSDGDVGASVYHNQICNLGHGVDFRKVDLYFKSGDGIYLGHDGENVIWTDGARIISSVFFPEKEVFSVAFISRSSMLVYAIGQAQDVRIPSPAHIFSRTLKHGCPL